MNFLKAVDAEVKAKNIELLITSILTDKIILNDSFLISTPSFVVNYKKIQSSSVQNELIFENGLFYLPSCADLTSDSNGCFNKIVILKVKF